MDEHLTGEGRQVVARAQDQARRLGHGFIGTEHLLYGLACADGQVGVVLRERGVTPERYEARFVALVGPGPGSARPGAAPDPLDRDALSAIGIDLDAVRERIEALFGPGALAPGALIPGARGPSRWPARWPRRPRRPAPGHLPVTRRARKCLAHSLDQARAADTSQLGAEHIALALLAMNEGLPPRILSAMGARAPELRTEILGRCRPPG